MNPVTEGQLGLAHAPKQILGEARHTQEHGLQDFMPLLGRRKNRGLRSDGHGTTNLAANPRPTQRRGFVLPLRPWAPPRIPPPAPSPAFLLLAGTESRSARTERRRSPAQAILS